MIRTECSHHIDVLDLPRTCIFIRKERNVFFNSKTMSFDDRVPLVIAICLANGAAQQSLTNVETTWLIFKRPVLVSVEHHSFRFVTISSIHRPLNRSSGASMMPSPL